MTWDLDASQDHVQKAKQKERHSQRTCRAGVLQTVGDGEMRFWRLLEAEMRLPSQREPARSLLGRPRHGGSLGRCEDEGLQPRLGRQDAEETKSLQTDRQGSWDSAVARGEEGVSEVPRAPQAKTAANGFRGLG